ncbi:FADH(2)-oxidizing methylenetetrahydrofolate--tRNA-(uracil(54)-C(5))-methyltransferase TrmFO [Synechococcus sp. FACHB-909]|uniref:FADH(2)-oxidizing methylenetetrahydrofolate--tRNA-(uracil(54)-C(5))- methyltransferase TrmFO n=1 Tax=Synechococcus sp. FACHB-909 TaxID=2692863 RepID=UPI001686533B|nr:FADH(2)-oxidizing methylenetetrahydrofolate--tRNA-(uracil(54)-C(5))-methyltransferase TrmFO [Synechococcus sp. FACHB-909]MBD2717920.1 FADH(2)-oxidizing methylenetetrahydrofolate--tRNA-(uracil(54)-C(5))-methyltransferase TrmFO [Synechococcus sp. FACHB-909]
MVVVIGAGLAGTEAAWQIAEAGIPVRLVEMRPVRPSPAHHSGDFAELVCSNSFGSLSPDRAAGLLQEELRRLGSLVIRTADVHAVPAGGALAVDRGRYSVALTAAVEAHPLVTVERCEQLALPDPEEIAVLATGPLTGAALAEDLLRFTGRESCHFFDAASPIVEGEGIDLSVAFRASRYDKGDADYINCPMDREQYLAFRTALLEAEKAELKDFEQESATFFEGCLPIEELARRGEDTMRYGPLKPIGLWDPRWGDLHDRDVRRAKRAHAVVQLRQEDKDGQLWNLVGFQTNLKWGEQQRVLRMIPGLENASFVRFGVMHRNTFLESPELLQPTLQFRQRPTLLAAGQITGTEGYAAAVAGGWLAGTNAVRLVRGLPPLSLPPTTMAGALLGFISDEERSHGARKGGFQPMPPSFGLMPELPERIRDKRRRYGAYRDRALADLAAWDAQRQAGASSAVPAAVAG